MPPRSWVERVSNGVGWRDHAEGGHFAAMKRPVELAEDIKPFSRAGSKFAKTCLGR